MCTLLEIENLSKSIVIANVKVLKQLRNIFLSSAKDNNDTNMYSSLDKKLSDINTFMCNVVKSIILGKNLKTLNIDENVIKFEFNINLYKNIDEDYNITTFICNYYIDENIIEIYDYNYTEDYYMQKIMQIKEKSIFNLLEDD